MRPLLVLAAAALSCTGVMGAKTPGPGGDGGTSQCACAEGELCENERCRARTCFDDPCPADQFCAPTTLSCAPRFSAQEPVYELSRPITGGAIENINGPFSGVQGGQTHGVLHPSGRFFYLFSANYLEHTQAVSRVDFAAGRVEWFTGAPEPGFVDGPAQVAMLAHDMYGSGGYGFSPDAKRLYFLQDVYGGALRFIDVDSGAITTVARGQLGRLTGAPDTIRSLAVGVSGAVYVTSSGSKFWVVDPAGSVTARAFVAPPEASQLRGFVDFVAADEARGALYTLTRDGAFFSWALDGTRGELLNPAGVGVANPPSQQYVSDGPVASGVFFGPTFLTLGLDRKLYIGGGDSRTFRRFDPDTRELRSLCWLDQAAGRIGWCIGDGTNNRLITYASGYEDIFCHLLTQDAAGNLAFGGGNSSVYFAKRVQ